MPDAGAADSGSSSTGGGSSLGGGTAVTGGGSAVGGGSSLGGGTAVTGGGSAVGGGSSLGGGTAVTGGGSAVGGGSALGGGTAVTGGGSAVGGGSSIGGGTASTGGGFAVDAGPSTALTFTAIPFSDPDLIATGRGVEHWGNAIWNDGSNGVPTVPHGNSAGPNVYYRFSWFDIETTTNTYDWTIVDRVFNQAIDDGKVLDLSVMNLFTAVPWTTVGGGDLSYPLYLHTQMQGDTANNRDWLEPQTQAWIPNWNSPYYLTAWRNLQNALAAHIATGTHAGKNYRDIVGFVDIRGYGDFGEWHTYPWHGTEPTGRAASVATLKAIIDIMKTAFPNYPLVAMMGTFDDGNASLIPPEVSYYALTTTNAWGRFGWRRDNWGDHGVDNVLLNCTTTYNGAAFNTLIMDAWKTAPIVGEPNNDLNNISMTCGTPQCDLEREIRQYHASSFGNGNFPIGGNNVALQNNVIAASKASGYRLVLTGGQVTTVFAKGAPVTISVAWQNVGIAPTYDPWNVVYELRSSTGTVAWTGTSSFALKLFLPTSTPTATMDQFTLPTGLAAGTYSLHLIIKDPRGYRKPLPLAIAGRATDGSYMLRSNITVAP